MTVPRNVPRHLKLMIDNVPMKYFQGVQPPSPPPNGTIYIVPIFLHFYSFVDTYAENSYYICAVLASQYVCITLYNAMTKRDLCHELCHVLLINI
jgi:hypothetical protein